MRIRNPLHKVQTRPCTDRVVAPACNDEVVVYVFSQGQDTDTVHWQADKIVNGERGTMGEFDLRFDPAEACWRELSGKHFEGARTDELNARLASRWDDLRSQIRRVTIGAARQREVLEAAGAPISPAELGWPETLLEDAIAHARELRNRYTFLDLAADLVT